MFYIKMFHYIARRTIQSETSAEPFFAVSEYLGECCGKDVATGNGTALTSETCLRATDIY